MRGKTSLRRVMGVCAALLTAAAIGQGANAATIEFDEAGVEAVFGQQTVIDFAGVGIDFRIIGTETIVDSELTAIESEAELDALWGNSYGGPLALNMFFVDDISWCGGPGNGIVGCGQRPGFQTAIIDSWAASAFGPELMAHEIGHNLGLPHTDFTNQTNLMWTSLNGDTTLDPDQVVSIFASPVVQTDPGSGNPFIEIVLINVVETATVPLPASGGVLIGAIAMAALLRRRRKSA